MDNNTQTSQKTTRNIILAVLTVVLLAVAAYVGGSLLRKQQAASENSEFKVIAAEGLPETSFELIGGVVTQEGNSLFVQPRQNQAIGMIGKRGVEASDETGPSTEVVITHDTEFFRDSTWDAYISGEKDRSALRGAGEVQQEIVPGDASCRGRIYFVFAPIAKQENY
jgi:hypothetical protein